MLMWSPISDCVSYPYVEQIQHSALAHLKVYSNLLLLTLLDIHSIFSKTNKQTNCIYLVVNDKRTSTAETSNRGHSILHVSTDQVNVIYLQGTTIIIRISFNDPTTNLQIHYYRRHIYNGQNVYTSFDIWLYNRFCLLCFLVCFLARFAIFLLQSCLTCLVSLYPSLFEKD